MGIFDRWRRKKTEPRETVTVKAKPPPTDLPAEEQSELASLVAEYERLSKRQIELKEERGMLTDKLDAGEITATKFRKELMARIQEASQVAESLKATSAKLSSMGYRGLLS